MSAVELIIFGSPFRVHLFILVIFVICFLGNYFRVAELTIFSPMKTRVRSGCTNRSGVETDWSQVIIIAIY